METSSPWLSVEEIAAHLKVSKESIYRWLDKGTIPAHRVGKQWRFRTTEVDDWVVSGGASDSTNKNTTSEISTHGTEEV